MGQMNDPNQAGPDLQAQPGEQSDGDTTSAGSALPGATGGTVPDRITGHNPMSVPGSGSTKA